MILPVLRFTCVMKVRIPPAHSIVHFLPFVACDALSRLCTPSRHQRLLTLFSFDHIDKPGPAFPTERM